MSLALEQKPLVCLSALISLRFTYNQCPVGGGMVGFHSPLHSARHGVFNKYPCADRKEQ